MGIGYDSTKGNEPLRRQLARRSVDAGIHVSPEDFVVTPGCQGASPCAKAVAKPGEIIAVESPLLLWVTATDPGFGAKAVEIPSDAGVRNQY